MNTETAIHCFEKAGLGKAGFRCVGLYSIPSSTLAEQNPTAYNNALADMPRDLHCGSCNFCGTPIMHNFIIESADGRRFVVGSDCVARTGDAGLIKEVKRVRVTIAKEKRETKRRMARAEREALWKAEREERAANFIATQGAMIERTRPYWDANEFLGDVMKRAIAGYYISEKAWAALERTIANIEENNRLREVSRHVGTVGKRETFNVRVQHINRYYRPAFNGFSREETVYIVTMRDENDNAIVSKSAAFCPEKGETLTIKATVKEHNIYKDEQQTIVQRVKVID